MSAEQIAEFQRQFDLALAALIEAAEARTDDPAD